LLNTKKFFQTGEVLRLKRLRDSQTKLFGQLI
jgi:hypothetical protein